MIREASFYVVIANQFFPCTEVEVELASNGSLSTVDGRSSLAMLRYQGIDIYGEAASKEGAAIDVYAGYDGNAERLFSGVLDEFDLDMDGDIITFSGRDHAAALTDTKDVPSNINYKNQTIGQIVEEIAKQYDLKSDVTDPGIKAGADLYDENAYMPHAQPPWNMLQDLAKQVGYECFIKPGTKELFFGPTEEAGGDEIKVIYGAKEEGSERPIRNLKITYQPRRNGNVDVEVISYHPTQAKSIKGKASAKGKRKSGKSKGKFIVGHPQKGKQTAKSGGSKPSAKPTVVIRQDGLTKEQADKKAEAIAKDIAKRQIIIKGTIEGMTDAKVHSKLNLKEGELNIFGFDSGEYLISAVRHKLRMPQGGSGGGWTTELTAMTEPEVSSGA